MSTSNHNMPPLSFQHLRSWHWKLELNIPAFTSRRDSWWPSRNQKNAVLTTCYNSSQYFKMFPQFFLKKIIYITDSYFKNKTTRFRGKIPLALKGFFGDTKKALIKIISKALWLQKYLTAQDILGQRCFSME